MATCTRSHKHNARCQDFLAVNIPTSCFTSRVARRRPVDLRDADGDGECGLAGLSYSKESCDLILVEQAAALRGVCLASQRVGGLRRLHRLAG